MDYEDPADNLCRVMKNHHRSTSGLLHQPSNLANVGYHSSPMMNYPTQTQATTTSTSTTIRPTDNTMMPSNPESLVSPPLVQQSPYDDSSSVQLGVSSTQASLLQTSPLHNHNNMSHGHYDDTQLVNSNTNATAQQQQNSTLPVHHGPFHQVQHRVQPPGNVIRTRPCLEDEHFCSIVSVVRIEFINDNLVSRFWAMER